jgi:hypothetical protein
VVSLLVLLIAAVLLVVGTLLVVSVWRSERNRKLFYVLLLGCEFAWFFVLERLFAMVSVPRAWQDGVEGVLFALVVASLVPLYQHRHDLDPDEP